MGKKIEKKRYARRKIHFDLFRKQDFVHRVFTKANIIYFWIGLFDVICVVGCARYNKAQYFKLLGNDYFVGTTKYLVFGRNYVNVIITLFFYIYFLLIRKFILKRKNEKMIVIGVFLILFVINIILFSCFSAKIY